jgi:hypothetical protein
MQLQPGKEIIRELGTKGAAQGKILILQDRQNVDFL